MLAVLEFWSEPPRSRASAGVREQRVSLPAVFLGSVYVSVRRLPPRRAVHLGLGSCDEVFAAGVLQLGAVSHFRRPLVEGIGASDASPFACGVVRTDCPPEIAAQLYAYAEVRGDLPLLRTPSTGSLMKKSGLRTAGARPRCSSATRRGR